MMHWMSWCVVLAVFLRAEKAHAFAQRGGVWPRSTPSKTTKILPQTSTLLTTQNHPRNLQLQALPMIPIEVVTCLLPTCGGFVSREFGVSYAYGTAVALTAGHVLLQPQKQLRRIGTSHWATWHAAALIFYGIRLCAFLFYRQQTSQRIQEMRKRIEQRAEASGSRMARAPFVLSCAYLYYGLCAPVYQTMALANTGSVAAAVGAGTSPLRGTIQAYLLCGLVSLTWAGFLIAAAGDLTKSFVKARKGEDHLVTSGIFRFWRHPNYSGEMMAWTASSVAGLVAFLSLQQFQQIKSWWYLVSNLLGVVGINFVLMLATKNLEKRQAETYGDTEAYQTWVSKSWGGFALPEKQNDDAQPHIEVNDQEEQDGTGI